MQPAEVSTALPQFSSAAGRITSSAIRDLLVHASQPGVISLAGGLPAPEAIAVDLVREAVSSVLATDPSGALQYSTTEGEPELRDWMASTIPGATAENVVVTTGSQQALDLLARTLLDPNDVIAVEDPGYIGALQAFRATGARLRAIPGDREGMDVGRIDGTGIRAVYLVPNFANPSGATLAAERRERLTALAEQHRFWVIEDDPYGDLRWRGEPPPSIAGMADTVVSVRTLSKVVAPGLRIGFIVGPRPLVEAIARMKQASDLHTSTLNQRIATSIVRAGTRLEDHVRDVVPQYQRRCDAMVESLRAAFGAAVDFTVPDGGMFVWARFAATGIDTQALLPEAVANGVAYVPGVAFGVDRAHRNALRLSFASVGPEQVEEGIRRLARTFDPHLR